MLAPNAMPSGSAPMKSAAAARPRSITASDARDVAKAPPRLAFASVRQALIASTTDAGTCEPPGPSKYAAPDASAGNSARIASVREEITQNEVQDAVVPVVEPLVGRVDADARLELLAVRGGDLERL